MGPSGAGSTAKMINQLIVGCTHAVLAEAVVLAESAGIDAARIPQCLAGGYADSTMLQKLYPRIVERDFAPQGYARQLLKDLEMLNEFAGGLKSPMPMAGQALSLYRMLVHLRLFGTRYGGHVQALRADASRRQELSSAGAPTRGPGSQTEPTPRRATRMDWKLEIRCWRRPRHGRGSACRAARRSSFARRTSARPTRRRRSTPTRWRSW